MGSLVERIFESARKFVKILAEDGHDFIIDEVILHKECLSHYVSLLKRHTVYFIGVICELNALEEREGLRGDRLKGIARDQLY